MYTTARGFQSRPNFQARGDPRPRKQDLGLGGIQVAVCSQQRHGRQLENFATSPLRRRSQVFFRFLLSEADPALGPQTALTDSISSKICKWSFLRIDITAHLSNFNLLVLNTYICLPEVREAVLGGMRHLPQGSVLFSLSFL